MRLISLALLTVSAWAATCPTPHVVVPGDSLAGLADFYFGDRDYATAILLATNSRVADKSFKFISNPDRITDPVCIPDATEAQRWHAWYSTYLRAVAAMTTTHPWETAPNLVQFPPDTPLDVATWTRDEKVATYQDKAPQDTWVTVEPHLKDFCRDFAQGHPGNPELLTQRLEQRLGLPPVAADTKFVRIRVEHPSGQAIFRPCSDPATDVDRCEAGPPSEKSDPAYAAWFYKQYYSVYGLARPNLYPWTSLGYTFDWAQSGDGEFVRVGESEFVIPEGTSIEVLGAVSTEEYCK